MAKKKRKIKIGRIFVLTFIIFIAIYIPLKFIDLSFKNIYITGNSILTDKEVMKQADIDDYPSSLAFSSGKVKDNLLQNELIKSVKVYKKGLRSLYIEIEENTPLFYNTNINKIVLLDGRESNKKLDAPILINYVPDTIYSKFVTKMVLINSDVMQMVSEIKYDVNEVDEERFLFYMEDGNYVYLTLSRLDKINNYQSIVKKFGNKRGIMYLDSGEYFKVMEN